MGPVGPVSQEQLMIAPPFFVTKVDLFGPVKSFVSGYEKESKLHIMVAVHHHQYSQLTSAIYKVCMDLPDSAVFWYLVQASFPFLYSTQHFTL